MKHTATEWLFEQLWEEPKDKFTWNAILIKAKEMETKQIKCYCGHTSYCDCSPLEEPKQETLEEAAKKYAESNQYGLGYYDEGGFQGIDEKSFADKLVDFTNKWQQERMFELVEEYNQMLIDPNVHDDHKEKSFKEWFEQFKKK